MSRVYGRIWGQLRFGEVRHLIRAEATGPRAIRLAPECDDERKLDKYTNYLSSHARDEALSAVGRNRITRRPTNNERACVHCLRVAKRMVA